MVVCDVSVDLPSKSRKSTLNLYACIVSRRSSTSTFLFLICFLGFWSHICILCKSQQGHWAFRGQPSATKLYIGRGSKVWSTLCTCYFMVTMKVMFIVLEGRPSFFFQAGWCLLSSSWTAWHLQCQTVQSTLSICHPTRLARLWHAVDRIQSMFLLAYGSCLTRQHTECFVFLSCSLHTVLVEHPGCNYKLVAGQILTMWGQVRKPLHVCPKTDNYNICFNVFLLVGE